MNQTVNNLITKHPIFEKLLLEMHNSSNGELRISGVPFVLQATLINLLSHKLERGIFYTAREFNEIRRYVNSLMIYDLHKLKYQQTWNILSNNNFIRVTKIERPGEFLVKGDTIAFWLPGYTHPIRASFLGEQFEQAAIFDEIYGKTLSSCSDFAVGELQELESSAAFENIFVHAPHKKLLTPIVIFSGEDLSGEDQFNFDFNYAPLFFQRFDLLQQEIAAKTKQGYLIKIFTKHIDVIPKALHKYIQKDQELDIGFVCPSEKILLLTDRELFGTIFIGKEVKRLSQKRSRKLLANLEGEIEIGDYVVHEQYGIGTYQGIKQEELTEKVYLGFGEYETKVRKEDYLLISYAEEDELYIPLNQIDQITKYISPDGNPPHITRLGGAEWTRIKNKVKTSVALLASELVGDYAKRELAQPPKIDVAEQQSSYEKFVHDFPYSETADQLTTERDIIKDLQGDRPMNRLIVGDVGFGKTEVAMRAAYQVVANGLQVAVLCPTTVLASQHEKVFKERFADTGFRIAGVSRISNKHKNKEVLTELATGKIDIIVGTHRLLSNDVQFKNLGMLVIDEEQKFGVKQKEKIKKMEYGVHVLSMSATPIPRTLSMAFSAIQDISIIQTPPEGRKAIKTQVQKINWPRIAEAINFEISRGGQIYFVYNEVRTMPSMFQKLRKLIPGLKITYAHGQMPPDELYQRITSFYNGEQDCLLCSTIIENGIDMPNVNTIIVVKSQKFGLGQLYQLRGRVGRGDKQAYAYFFYDGEDIDKKKQEPEEDEQLVKIRTKKYIDRLKAIMESQELGSGFRLASRDLEIRGAGNLLGREQHGNISQIGYGLYMQMLADEIERLKNLQQG